MSAIRRSRADRALRREGDVMGLTVAIALLVGLTAGDDAAPHTKLDVLAIVWGTTVGLSLAHAFALLVSARLVRDVDVRYGPLDVLASQLSMAVVVAACATVVALALSDDFDRLGARLTATVFIGGLVAIESRAGGSTVGRAVALGAGATVVGVVIATAKWWLGT